MDDESAQTARNKEGPHRTTKWMERFLESLAQLKDVSQASKVVGISRRTAYNLRKDNPDFQKRWDETFETCIDDLETSALKRATEGWKEEVYYEGRVVGTRRRFSTGLTIFMLKCRRPSVYAIDSPMSARSGMTEIDKATAAREAIQKATQSFEGGSDA